MNKSKKKSEKRKNKIELRYYPLFYIFSSLFLVSARYQILLVLVLLALSASTLWSRFWLHLLFLTFPLISVIFVCSAFSGLRASHMGRALESGNWKDKYETLFLTKPLEPHMIWWYVISSSFILLCQYKLMLYFFIYIKNWLLLLLDRYFIFGLEMVILDLGYV